MINRDKVFIVPKMASVKVVLLGRDICSLPNEWFIQLLDYVEPREKRKQSTPPVINMDVLKRLCKEHLYTIGAGIQWDEPDLLIRYVIAENKFGYKAMGNFFFLGDTLYVWDFDDAWAPDHNADIVEEIFHDECKGRGYAHRVLFAGVKTPYKDSKGESIFTGDVCHIKFHGSDYDFPLTTLGWEENPEHFYGQNPDPIERRLEMAKYTPSFHEKYWEYVALKVLEIEYDWRYYPGLPKRIRISQILSAIIQLIHVMEKSYIKNCKLP